MEKFFQDAHSFLAYIVVVLIIIYTGLIFYAFITKSNPNKILKKTGLYAMISVHIQVIIGLILYLFLSPMGLKLVTSASFDMSNSTMRLYGVEHPIMMLLGAALVTITYSKIKRLKQPVSFGIFILILLADFCILSRIPYQSWF